MRWPKTGRQWQSGATLVEVLVATAIMGLALALIVGTFSTGLLDSVLAKRNTASVAALQYELHEITGAPFNNSPQPYSDCFATDDAASPPTTLSTFQAACPSSSYTMRVDVTETAGPGTTQQWTITVIAWPGGDRIGVPVSVFKVNR